MANFRTISPSFWSDPFVEELAPSEKLLYIYLFSNEHVSNIGVTEASIRKVAFETGIDASSVSAFIGQMSSLGKVVHDGGQILAVNFIRNQTKFGKDKISEKLAANLQRLFDELESPLIRYTLWKRYPDVFNHVAEVEIPYPKGIETPSEGMDALSKGYQPEKSAADTLGINRKVESSNGKEEIGNIYSASGDAPRTHDSTQKPAPKPKAVLEGKRLETFNRFWKAYGWPKGKGGAEKAWAAIPELTDALVDRICEAAKREAAQRPALQARGLTPKYAQGWLNERRWEDDYEATQPQAMSRQGSLFAQTQAGQPKSWDQIRYENNLQAARAAYEQIKAEEQGFDAQEEEYEPERWNAEVVGDE